MCAEEAARRTRSQDQFPELDFHHNARLQHYPLSAHPQPNPDRPSTRQTTPLSLHRHHLPHLLQSSSIGLQLDLPPGKKKVVRSGQAELQAV